MMHRIIELPSDFPKEATEAIRRIVSENITSYFDSIGDEEEQGWRIEIPNTTVKKRKIVLSYNNGLEKEFSF